jgi:hypothetical protein
MFVNEVLALCHPDVLQVVHEEGVQGLQFFGVVLGDLKKKSQFSFLTEKAKITGKMATDITELGSVLKTLFYGCHLAPRHSA